MKFFKSYKSVIVVIGLIIIVYYSFKYYQHQQSLIYNIPINHESNNRYIDQISTKHQIIKYIPFQYENEYFSYWIYPSFRSHSIINIYLTPIQTNSEITNADFLNTKNEILNWITSKKTLISDIQIDWYIYDSQINKNIIFDQTNPK